MSDVIYEVLKNGEWVKTAPKNGDRVRYVDKYGGLVEVYPYSDHEDRPEAKKITKLAFKRRLTQTERVAVRQAAKQDPLVEDFVDLMDAATYIDLTRTDTIAGVNQLEQVGLIAEGRAQEILDGTIQESETWAN